MSMIDYFLKRKKTATIAKDRLQILISQERAQNSSPDYLPMMRKEIMEIVAKYTKVDTSNISVDLHTKDNSSMLELNVTLPETAKA